METTMFRTDHYPAFSLPLTMTGLRARPSRGAFVRHAVETSGAALLQVARAIAGRFEMRRQMHVLAALDDRMLKDIGVMRGEIPYLVRRAVQRID
jgi:uncharacterized protein YjiS (DUF1127 family)